jgi:hypothetical protein
MTNLSKLFGNLEMYSQPNSDNTLSLWMVVKFKSLDQNTLMQKELFTQYKRSSIQLRYYWCVHKIVSLFIVQKCLSEWTTSHIGIASTIVLCLDINVFSLIFRFWNLVLSISKKRKQSFRRRRRLFVKQSKIRLFLSKLEQTKVVK